MRTSKPSERGFTLAGLIVILTVIMIVVAYTVPRQWSMILKRERDRQTMFVMRQYARSILKWRTKHQGWPVSLDQIKEAKSPRMIRGLGGELPNPFSGKVDWILVPPGAVSGAPGQPPPGVQQGGTPSSPWARNEGRGATSARPNTPAGPGGPLTFNPELSPKDYVGPFIGVRPNLTGPSFLALNGAESYEQWSFTALDLEQEINARRAVMALFK